LGSGISKCDEEESSPKCEVKAVFFIVMTEGWVGNKGVLFYLSKEILNESANKIKLILM